MENFLVELVELIGLGGLVSLLAFVSWTKMALGAVLCVLGAFYPQRSKASPGGEATLNALSKFVVHFKGGLRFGVVVAGMVLLVGAVTEASREKDRADYMQGYPLVKKPVPTEHEAGIRMALLPTAIIGNTNLHLSPAQLLNFSNYLDAYWRSNNFDGGVASRGAPAQ